MNIYTKYRLIPLARDRNRISNFMENITPTNDDAVIHSFYQEFFQNTLGEINSDKVIDEFQKERSRLTNEWEEANRILETCPGKDLIEKIGHWASTEYGIQKITAPDLCHHIDVDDVDHDFNQFVEKIIKNCNYDTDEYLNDKGTDCSNMLVASSLSMVLVNVYGAHELHGITDDPFCKFSQK